MSRLLKLLKLFILGLRRHPLRFVLSVFLTYSAIWTILESSSYLFPSLKPQGWIAILAMIFVGLCVGIYRVFPQQDTQLRIKSIDTTIEIAFGDLFESSGLKIIPVNEFFDSELGDPVSPRSLHGQLIKRLFGSHPASFDTLVEEELEGEPHSRVNRTRGKEKQYPIGTTPLIKVNDEGFFLPALCHTDVRTFKASCDIPTLWEALTGLWSAVRNRAGGEPVSVPLVGGGLAGIGLPPSLLLELILLSIVTASRERHITSVIHVVLPWNCFEEVDLEALNNHWS